MKEIKMEIKLESGVIVEGNKIELSRVFYNVLDNALKYTPIDGIIVITDKIVANKYLLTIEDNGIGIPEDSITKIFEPFYKGSDAHPHKSAG